MEGGLCLGFVVCLGHVRVTLRYPTRHVGVEQRAMHSKPCRTFTPGGEAESRGAADGSPGLVRAGPAGRSGRAGSARRPGQPLAQGSLQGQPAWHPAPASGDVRLQSRATQSFPYYSPGDFSTSARKE